MFLEQHKYTCISGLDGRTRYFTLENNSQSTAKLLCSKVGSGRYYLLLCYQASWGPTGLLESSARLVTSHAGLNTPRVVLKGVSKAARRMMVADLWCLRHGRQFILAHSLCDSNGHIWRLPSHLLQEPSDHEHAGTLRLPGTLHMRPVPRADHNLSAYDRTAAGPTM